MDNYPKRFTGEPDGRWPKDLVEDYRNARNDDERRQMLLIFGVDDAHQQDAKRLFVPSGSSAADNEKSGENNPAQNAEPETDRSKISINRKQNRIDGIIVGIVSGLIVGLILLYWPDTLSFFTNLLQKLSPP